MKDAEKIAFMQKILREKVLGFADSASKADCGSDDRRAFMEVACNAALKLSVLEWVMNDSEEWL